MISPAGPRRACPIRPSCATGASSLNVAFDLSDALTLRVDHRLSPARHRRLCRHRRDPARGRRRLRRRRPEPDQPGVPARSTRRPADRRRGPLLPARAYRLASGGLWRRPDRAACLGIPTLPADRRRRSGRPPATPPTPTSATRSSRAPPVGRRPLHQREQGLFPHHLDLLDRARCLDQPRAVPFDAEKTWERLLADGERSTISSPMT